MDSDYCAGVALARLLSALRKYRLRDVSSCCVACSPGLLILIPALFVGTDLQGDLPEPMWVEPTTVLQSGSVGELLVWWVYLIEYGCGSGLVLPTHK